MVANPLRKLRIKIKEPSMLHKALTLAESSALLTKAYAAIVNEVELSYAYLDALRKAVVIELLFATGARVSEIADLRRSSFDLHSGIVNILAKGGNQRMIHICNRDIIDTPNAYCNLFADKILANSDFLLVNGIVSKLTDQSIRIMLSNMASSANIVKRVTQHIIRHTFATLLLEMT